jgi:hypothetical protein
MLRVPTMPQPRQTDPDGKSWIGLIAASVASIILFLVRASTGVLKVLKKIHDNSASGDADPEFHVLMLKLHMNMFVLHLNMFLQSYIAYDNEYVFRKLRRVVGVLVDPNWENTGPYIVRFSDSRVIDPPTMSTCPM